MQYQTDPILSNVRLQGVNFPTARTKEWHYNNVWSILRNIRIFDLCKSQTIPDGISNRNVHVFDVYSILFFYVNSYQCQTSRNPDEGHGQRDGVFWEEYPWQVTHRLLLVMLFLAGFSYLASYFSWVVQKSFKWTKGARQEFCKAWINSSDIQNLGNDMARYRYFDSDPGTKHFQNATHIRKYMY